VLASGKIADKYVPQITALTAEIATLKNTIRIADEQAKIQQDKHREALNENRIVAKDLAGRISAYADTADKRVQELRARDKAHTAIIAASAAGNISGACEQGTSGQSAEQQEIKYIQLEQRCVTDAVARVIIRDWALRIGLKPAP
jgi:hypothetical protein